LIAIIPIFALSAVSAYTVLKFRDQLSNMYFGVNLNQVTLQEGDQYLQSTKISLLQYSASSSPSQQSAAISDLDTDSKAFIKTFAEYKKVSTFPIQVEFVNSDNIDQLIQNEEQLLMRINSGWNQYHDKLRDLTILSKDPSFRQTGQATAAQALDMVDDLEGSYQELIVLNSDLARISYEASSTVVQLAYFYVSIAAAISAASATGAAILVSKRVILGDLVKKTKVEMVETTLRDLLGEGADLILEVVKKEIPEGKDSKK
jgi:hypothetical protein